MKQPNKYQDLSGRADKVDGNKAEPPINRPTRNRDSDSRNPSASSLNTTHSTHASVLPRSTTMATTTASFRPSVLNTQPLPRRKKEQRTEIWSNLLRQTREAQARSRTQAVQQRSLLLCGGSPDDQRAFCQGISRPPPPQPLARNQERKQQRPKGELRLSNKYAYGYGHVSLFSPPQQSGTGVQVLGAEAEECAHVEVHTIPEAEREYVPVLRRLLAGKREGRARDGENGGEDDEDLLGQSTAEAGETRRPGVCILLSWNEPWKFLQQLRRWLQLIAEALLPADALVTDPMDVLKDAGLAVTVVAQHTEAQEALMREGYKEEDFDYISQCLRTAILPLHPFSALVYTTSTAPPQQPGTTLNETQKVVYSSLVLDLAALSPKLPRTGDAATKQELGPKHEFMDRMAIVIPAGWDSAAFIRTLSETFAPEEMLSAWLSDLQPPPPPPPPPPAQSAQSAPEQPASSTSLTTGTAEVYESQSSPIESTAPDDFSTPGTPSKQTPSSAVRSYETKVHDPQAHKAPKAPTIDIRTKPDQVFLSEMRSHLAELEAHDRSREASSRVSSAVSNTSLSSASGRGLGLPTGEQTGALNQLGDVSFNVGGVSYDTASAEAAIERLKRPTQPSGSLGGGDALSSPGGGGLSTPRNLTPKPGRPMRSGGERDASAGTPVAGSAGGSRASSGAGGGEMRMDKLEEYFSSLMKKSQATPGTGSRDGTPTRATRPGTEQ